MPAVSQSGVYNTQEFTDLGALSAAGRIYTYVAGTTTNKTAYTEPTGTTAHTYTSDGIGGSFIALNARGELPAPLYLLDDGPYDITYRTSLGNLLWTRRTASVANILSPLSGTTGAGLVGLGSSTVAAQIRLDLRKFGGSPAASGSVNQQAYEDAYAEIISQNVKGQIWIGAGSWTFAGTAGADGIVHGFHPPYLGFATSVGAVEICGEGRNTQILAGTNNMIQARWAACFGGISGVTFDANSKTGVTALYVGHDSSTSTATAQTNAYNVFSRIWVKGGHSIGFWLRPGCHVGGDDSQVLSNDFDHFYIKGAVRGILLDDNQNNTVGTSNRNNFTHFEIGQPGTNIGVEIRTGAQNNFSHGVINGVDTGVKTGTLIENTGNGGLANDLNCFTMVNNENNVTYDLNNANPNTQIIGGFWDFVLKATGTAPGLILPSASYVSFMPLRLPAITYSEGVPGGYSSGSIGITKDINDLNQPWASNTSLVAGSFDNVAALSGSAAIRYVRLSHMVYLNWRMNFRAIVAATRITIPSASLVGVNTGLAPAAAMIAPLANNPLFPVIVGNGTNFSLAEAGFTSTGDIYINAPSGGNWDTVGANNSLNVILQYEAA